MILFCLLLHGFFPTFSQPREDLSLSFDRLEIGDSSGTKILLGPVENGLIVLDQEGGIIKSYSLDGQLLESGILSELTGNKSQLKPFYSNSSMVFLDSVGSAYILSNVNLAFKPFSLPDSYILKDILDVYIDGDQCYLLTRIGVETLELKKISDDGSDSYPQIITEYTGQVSIAFQSNGISRVPYLSLGNELLYFDKVQGEWTPIVSISKSADIFNLSEFGSTQLLLSVYENEKDNYFLINTITNSHFPLEINLGSSFSKLFIGGDKNDNLFIDSQHGIYRGYQVITEYQFSVIDLALFGGYFVLLIFMGYSFSKNAHSTEEYFKVKKKIPWWAAGVSILATKLSAVTFLSLPVKAFATDWMYFWLPVGNIFLAIFVVKYILPFYANLNVTTSFEYLEKRFNISVRKLGAYTYIISEITKSGVVILIPSLVISVVSGIDLFLCIFLIGIVVTVYTVLGGIEAVIWIDVVQVIVMVGGVAAAILIVSINLDVLHLKSLFRPVLHTYKINVFDLEMDLSRATLMVIVLSWFGKIQDYLSNQAVVQKLITTKDIQSTRRSTWMACLLNIPVNLIFLVMGSALFLFYQDKPERMDPLLPMPDALFVDFITAELPHGLVALVIAGVFAAAMSTLAGSMNSMSTTVIINLLGNRKEDDRKLLRLARMLIIVFGLLATFSAAVVALFEIKSLYDLVFLVIGLFGGGLAGLFILGMFTIRANALGATGGFVGSAAILYYVIQHTQLNLFLYGPIGIFSCVLIGYLISRLIPSRELTDPELTIYRKDKF